MIVAWRIDMKRHAATAFTGEGARRFGGRWNHRAPPMVSPSGPLALAAIALGVQAGGMPCVRGSRLDGSRGS